MNWLTSTLSSSIGKKLLMAITGFGFLIFLTSHLAGNLTIYGGADALNAYAEKLHSLGKLINVAELGLLLFAIIHVVTGSILFFQNLNARPVRYRLKKTAGGRTFSSSTMPYTGFLILLFVIMHLFNFHFVDKSTTPIYQYVASTFSKPAYILIYIAAMIVVAIHVRHGLWSAFQTIGANHPKYMPFIMKFSIVFALIVGIGFGFLPIFVAMSS